MRSCRATGISRNVAAGVCRSLRRSRLLMRRVSNKSSCISGEQRVEECPCFVRGFTRRATSHNSRGVGDVRVVTPHVASDECKAGVIVSTSLQYFLRPECVMHVSHGGCWQHCWYHVSSLRVTFITSPDLRATALSSSLKFVFHGFGRDFSRETSVCSCRRAPITLGILVNPRWDA